MQRASMTYGIDGASMTYYCIDSISYNLCCRYPISKNTCIQMILKQLKKNAAAFRRVSQLLFER